MRGGPSEVGRCRPGGCGGGLCLPEREDHQRPPPRPPEPAPSPASGTAASPGAAESSRRWSPSLWSLVNRR